MTADYTVPLFKSWTGSVGASDRFSGTRPAGFDGSTVAPQYWMHAYNMVDFRASVSSEHLSLALFLKNAFNTLGEIAANTGFITYNANAPIPVAVTAPRTIGLTLTLE